MNRPPTLVQSDRLWRDLVENLDEGVIHACVIRDPEGRVSDCRYVFVNAAWGRLMGLDPSAAEGRTMRELFPALDPGWLDALTKALDDQHPTPFTRRGPDSDRWYEGHFYPANADDVSIVFRDITDRRLAEQAGQRRALELEAQIEDRTRERDRIWQVSSDLLGIADVRGVWLSVNPAWTRVLGWDADQIIGRTSEWMEHPDDKDKTRAELEHLASGQTTLAFENRFKAKDGSYRHLSWTAVPMEGRLYCVTRDVTEEKMQAEALRDMADFRRLAFSAVGGVGVWTYDIASDQFFCDAAIAQLYNLDGDRAAAGMLRADFLAHVHPDDLPALRATMSSGLKRSGDLELEYRLIHADGSVHWVLSRGHTYFDAEGRPARRTGIGIDMTRQRLLEEQLRQSQKLEAVGQLTGGIAHDFNNLLTVIRTSIDLMRRPELTADRRARFMESISNATTRATKLTGQLLAFARRQALQPTVLDAGQNTRAVSEMVDTLTGALVDVEVKLFEETCFVLADPSQFDTAIVNLAVNARDAMVAGGRLTLEVRPVKEIPAIRGHASVEGEFVAISVTDTGVGIDPKNLTQIFEPFYTTKALGHGTGLGLSQVFGFAKQSGGEIQVESTPGRGSTFTLYLPRSASPATAQEERHGVELVRGTGECILIVEDNAEVAASVDQTIQELGYATVLATNGSDAIARLQRNAERFAAVFSDVVMPGMSGIELGQEIRRLHGSLPVVLSSGYSYVLAQGNDHGFALLSKPYAVEDLARALGEAIMKRRAEP